MTKLEFTLTFVVVTTAIGLVLQATALNDTLGRVKRLENAVHKQHEMIHMLQEDNYHQWHMLEDGRVALLPLNPPEL